MIQDITEMIVTERNTYRKTESAHCHTVEKEMAKCSQGVPKVYSRCTQALGRLMSMLRSSLGAGKEQLRSSLEYAYALPTLCLHSAVMVILMMVVGVNEALAQTDYSGTYYIGSNGWSSGNNDNYYLCPTEGWCYYKATNDFTSEANDTPFLTTYQVKKKAGYDKSKAIWIVEKHPTLDYYYIKNAVDGRYIVFNDKINTTSNEDRMRVHLDPSYTDNRALFRFTKNGNVYNIRPHEDYSNKWWTVNGGNKDALTGQSGKANGPTGYTNTAGIIGVYKDLDGNSNFYLEPVIPLPSLSVNADGSVSIAKPEGTTIRYTLDGTTPTASNGATALTVSASEIAGATGNAIQAIVVTSNASESEVVSLPLKNYTYNILTKQSNATDVAITKTIKQVQGAPLTDFTSIPADIRSPYLAGETVKFYNNADHSDAHQIKETPTTGTDIYVTYTTDFLSDKFLHLKGARALNVKINDELIYDNNGALSHQTGNENTTKPYLWYFSGEDPYAIEISNGESGKKLGYASSPSSLSYAPSPENTKFILMSGSANDTGDPRTYEQMELMAATGDGTYYRVGRTDNGFSISTTATGDASLQIKVGPVTIPATFKLIDKAGKILAEITSTSGAVELPDEWKSPLVSEYQYWKESAFTIEDDVYTLKANPAESDKAQNVTDSPIIYVTYEVNDKVNFETSDETTDDDNTGATYRLQFFNGESFHQENGKDAVMTTAQQGVYPYFCGDGMFYVYGDDQWNTQLNSGASTRSRWLWYVVSPTSDPYHVKIMSYHLNAKPIEKKHGYFRTFPVTYNDRQTGTEVTRYVTSLTTTEEDASSAKPTEYMVLTGASGHCKLVTVDEIEGAPENGSYGTRQTVKTLEQYWKNNPTVQNALGNAKVTQVETYSGNITLTDQQEAILPTYWHTYQILVNSAPWVGWTGDGHSGTGRQYKNKNHWFQTVNMSSTEGSDGEFEFVETTLTPQVILIDNHGWEIMRKPLYDKDGNLNTELKLYDSDMVKTYYWHPKSTKIDGYHKYSIAEGDEKITVYNKNEAGKWVPDGNTTTFTSNSLYDDPYVKIKNEYQEQDASVKTDFYITYDVKPEYANLYRGAATEGDVNVSAFWVKQGAKYAKNDGDALTTVDAETDDDELKWYVKPNFNIDAEMGYQYSGEHGEKTKSETEAEYVAAGKNGFDPYNVQIQSVKNTYLYFKITTSANSQLSEGAWKGSSTALSLMEMSSGTQNNVEGYDQTKLSITNATFMVVKDASGHMLLMPRFDHTKVVNSFTAPQLSTPNAASQTLELKMAPKVIHSSSEFAGMNGQYFLADDFEFVEGFESLGSAESPFTGSIDGGLNTLNKGLEYLTTPLIAYADGAIIKNIILDNVTVGNAKGENEEDIPNVGAIVANATGETRIYNCGINSGSVGGTGDVGGIVGSLDGSARVINCYSFATITNGTNVGGIVGNNKGTTTAASIKTMVMNCMFYGDITGGSTVSPVFGGNNIANLQGGLNTFNYYAYDKLKTKAISSNKYNSALAVEEKFLNRFEYYRLLLNSNKKLAAFYATSSEETVKPSDMMKWVLETADRNITAEDAKNYPILKKQGYYPSIINPDFENAPDSASVGRNHGGKLGKTLSVTISGVGSNAPSGASITTGSLTLQRTDKDFDRFNFNYDKVQLPYYNDVGEGNYTEYKVVTGWKITAITAVAGDPYTSANYPTTGIKDFPDHNYADRRSSNKDLYSVSNRVFSQGAYFDVPYGVTSITIEPYWANAIYVADANYDVVYKADYSGKQNVTQTGTQAVDNTTTFNGQKIRTSITGLGSGTTVYDNAVVLVGNFHLDNVPTGTNGTTPFTMMSVDEDNDHEPDYSLIYHHKSRSAICPIRFDFLNIPGTAQAQKPNGANLICNFTIFKTKGWFEVTNTSSFYSSQLEYENLDGVSKSDAPLILQGGVIDQFVSTQSKSVTGKTIYIHLGGNVWIKEFGMGTHSDGKESTPHVPVSVTGGEFPGFYLTGTYKADANVRKDNAECYISGGYIHEAAGASLEQIDGNVHWQIYNADIDNFFGGGINDAKPITGNITTDIFNSHVTLFCGGPKFGNMQTDKTVTTNAEGCTFEKFFGAGYGGTSIAKKKYYDKDGTQNWGTLQGYYTTDRGKYFDGATTGSSQTSGKDYGKKGPGVATDFDYEFFVWTSGSTGARLYVNFASFSLAQCNDVESNLKGCTINQDFYGGGSLGKVIGKATSVLDGCTVHGNVFGGGYSATLPTIQVRDAGFTTDPNYNSSSGMFEPGVFSGTTEFTWKNASEAGKTLTNGQSGSDLTNHYLYTNADLTALGQVKETDLTVKNNCSIVGGVYGGGDMSSVNENTLVKIENAGGQNAIPNVYGGGNTADVEGNTEVRMTSGTVSHDIYGGGRGETTIVGGNVIVNMGAKAGEAPSITYSGTGVVQGDVYGGSALGKVNTTADKTTTVNVYGGTVNGSVFGGGLGQLEVAADPGNSIAAKPAIVAENQGNTTINVEGGLVKTAVYGGSNVNGVLKKDATVTLIGGTVGDSENSNNNVVFGGGKGAPTLVNGNVTVSVGTKSDAEPPVYAGTATIYGHVYGGGALGNTNEAWVTDTSTNPATTTLQPVANTQTLVNLYAGTINGYAYGGALGNDGTPAIVGGDVTVTLDGAKVHQVFGANNVNGTPKGHVKVWVKKTNNFTDNEYKNTTTTPRASRTTYDVEAVYGGGNQADYIPADALLDPAVEGNSAKIAAATAEVLIEGCQKTSIDKVYGGGNAAAVPATDVTVKGSYIINTLYGGGNGESTPTFTNPGANVGIYKVGDTPTNYGTGKAETKLLAGYINEVYGGSNTKGDVRGGTDVRTKGKTDVITGDCCTELNAGQVYGAGSHADVKGNVNIILECMPEDYVAAVYGGAEEAIVEGNVSLTVTSGKFGRVFGGNNKGGSIQGSITVIAKEEGCKPLEIGELYGGGNEAPYSHYGCTKESNTWTPNTTGTDYTEGKDHSIEVIIESCTSIGKVFGGGNKATVIGNTKIGINMFRGTTTDNPDTFRDLGKIGQVFGGGNLANVIGNTTVNIGTDGEYINPQTSTVDEGQQKGVNITNGTYINPEANSTVEISKAGIYGGGNDADVEGNTTVNIGTAHQTLGVNITGDIFGGGFGEKTTVTGDVVVNIGKKTETTVDETTTYSYEGYATITGDVYGGSAKGKVNATKSGEQESPTYSYNTDKTTHVNFYGGTIKDTDPSSGKGNIYGGGLGEDNEGTENDHAADVYGPVTVTMEKGSTTNTTVNNVFGCNNVLGTPKDTVAVMINGGTVNHNVYGGGNNAAYTPTFELAENARIYPAVYVINGTIEENVFGGGLGETATVTGNPHITIGDNKEGHVVAIKKSVYGGGSLATVDGNTNIVVNKGTIGTEGEGGATYGNIYGGGFGSNAGVQIGIVKKNTSVTVKGGNVLHNIYGGGAYGSVGTYSYDGNAITALATANTGKATIRITGGTIGTDGHENGMIFGASRGDIAAPGAIQDNMAWVYDTEVIIGTEGDGENVSSPLIRGSVYGSGENGHTFHNANVTIYSGMVGITTTMPTDPAGQEGSKYPYRGNVYGGGCGTDKYYSGVIPSGHTEHDGQGDKYNKIAGIVGGNATVTIDGGHVVRNVYGAGAMGSVTGKTTVNISGKSMIGANGSGGGYVYAAARGEDGLVGDYATTGSTALKISGGTVWGSAFGGGQSGVVKGSVVVNVSGGVVKNDVYGGGALAETNMLNWTPGSKDIYVEVLGLATEKYIEKTDIVAGSSSVSGLYTRSGTGTEQDPYTYTQATGTALSDTKYYEHVPASSLDGLYERSGTEGNYTYTETTKQSYDGTGTYYEKRQIPGDWATGMNVPNSEPVVGRGPAPAKGTKHKTLVTLTGGVIGNVYGGGLGRLAKEAGGGEPAVSAIAANVYGDVRVSINHPDSISKYGGSGVAFTKNPVDVTTTSSKSYSAVPTAGRVFGCNNLNGCPLGDVLVEVYGTRQIDEKGNLVSGHKNYEIQAVYGGGDQADYLPNENKKTQVIIDGCGETSISRVYGGGNSAAVPATDVVIWGSYDIEYAFGGGNGSQPINRNGSWVDNTGANVNGAAKITCHGGKIGQVFGGSDALGVCRSSNPTLEQAGSCPLVITKLYGAGSEADVDGDVNVVIAACTETNSQIEYVCGGSYKAHIKGDVTLTITSGYFKNVYGGNDQRGGIGGNITVNIEETDPCDKPIIIENLVGGGNNAKYPGESGPFTFVEKDRKITVNVKSATRIDNVYGGSFIEEANANTQVNINMVRGGKNGRKVLLPIDYEKYSKADGGTYHNIKNIKTSSVEVTGLTPGESSVVGYYENEACTISASGLAVADKTYYEKRVTGNIDEAIGTIGNVYGGGQQGKVTGNTEVNIGSSTTVGIMRRNGSGEIVAERDGSGNIRTITYDDQSVLGAHITGDVFGGGEKAEVTGNAEVFICAKRTGDTTFDTVTEGAEKVTIGGSVYGGGSEADVLTNARVTMAGGYVFDGVYGGGLKGSVGTFTRDKTVTTESNNFNHSTHSADCLGKPTACADGTGTCTVVVSGGQIGPDEAALSTGGMRNTGNLPGYNGGPVDVGFVFGAGRGEVEDPNTDKDADFHTFVNETYVTVSGGLVMASVYGGGENGRVLHDTHVTISGGQIGCGEVTSGTPAPYSDGQFIDPTENEITAGNALAECPSWEFNKNTYKSYDPLADVPYIDGTPVTDASTTATDGNTYYGSVFGGGSGYYPYEVKNMAGTVTGHEWLRSAGQVYGNTNITISGGHILTAVYGGNETTDVGTYENELTYVSGGKSTITMSGGTVGVPRTTEQIELRPVSCSLFGAGKGDHRTHFNTWTNVNDVEINISGGIIYGSVFGGGEEGHVLRNVVVNISGTAKIGTHGTTSYEGNVFGGGRGFSGMALTAGSTGGNVTMSITGGTMLGNVYGGGRLASVGIGFTPPEDIYYGQLIDDIDEDHNGNMEPAELKHGHIAINISGGKIGKTTANETATHPVGGNVYGGSMGRTTYLNGERNPLWPKQAVAKESTITITGGEIMNSVYGGSELGIVRNRATVNIRPNATPANSPVIHGNVFGGGYGSDDQDPSTISAGGYASIPTVYYTFTPMIWTGCVSGDTFVNISGGKVEKNVYGGGNFASVGLMNYNSSEDGKTYNYIKKHDTTNGFGLSWPYEFQYIQAAPTDDAPGGKAIGGKTTINITGGRIGTTTSIDNAGFVYGGSKGQVSFKKADNTTPITDIDEQVYAEAFCANVRETEVTINYDSTPESDDGSTTPCIVRSVYGGGEDGHVLENAVVNLNRGWIGRTLFGGGKGTSTYKGTKYVYNGSSWTSTDNQDIHSWTAGKVYGNTTVTMNDGKVGWFVYGGGNMASVGKGNYSGGADDYSTTGYGETLTGNLWTSATDGDNAWQFLNSGIATVTIKGGTVGTATVGFNDDGIPYGSVFGGSRGTTAIETNDVMSLSPLYKYLPDFYCGYANKTVINVGGTTENGAVDGAGPTIYGSIYGGAQDGHVRNSTEVKMFKGSVAGQTSDTAGRSGHVFGAGSGIGKYTDPSDSKNKINSSSGSVTCTTLVELNGGSIAGNIYGGGAMASVGPPKIGDKNEQHAPSDGHKSISKTQVDVKGGSVGGSVYGASRGPSNAFYESQFSSIQTYDKTKFATDIWSDVSIAGGTISNNVYGGGEGGIVKESTMVSLTGGSIAHNAYGGGQGTKYIESDILGNTTVELNNNNNGGEADGSKKGCSVDKVFGCNDLNGTPKGHVLVHVYGTQNSGTADMSTKVGPGSRTSLDQGKSEGYIVYMQRLIALAKVGGVLKPGITESVITTAEGTISGKVEASLTDDEKTAISNEAKNVIAELQKLHGYDVTAVYGGGDLAPYVPTVAEDNTEVIIEGCGVSSIKQVYGGGNAAYAPATNVLVKSAYVIDELFGGGNGLDNYVKDGMWYENPGANVGYKQLAYYDTSGSYGSGADEANKYTAITYTDATTPEGRKANYSIGTGIASTTVNGGHIHNVYGGSNKKGNIRAEALLQIQQVGTCPLITDKTYSGSKEATIDAETNTIFDCVREGNEVYGGSKNADILNDVHVRITNGHYTKVFGGNEVAGTITGSITIDIEENGCTPIEIDELYAGGYLAPYSVYGYSTETRAVKDENGNVISGLTQRIPYKKGDTGALATPSRDPQINIISATKIGKIYGGGYMADLIGSPHINVNMTTGRIREAYASEYTGTGSYPYITATDAAGNKIIPVGVIGTIFGGGNKGDIYGDTYVEIGTGEWLNFTGQRETTDADGKVYVYNSTTKKWDWTKKVGETTESGTVDNKPVPARNAAFVLREGTGGQVFGGGDQGYIFGNTNVNIGNGYIYDRVYGGGNDGTVGTVSTRAALPEGHTVHDGCLNGKPTAFAENTGRTAVTVSGGYVGPYTYARSASTGVATPTSMTMPQDYGYVFGAGRGRMANPHTSGNEDIEFMTYVDSTRVTISGNALIAGGVYGGSENGRVLHNTGVYIEGGQIGLGAGLTTAYADEDFIDPTTATAEQIAAKAATMAECAAWTYGNPWLPYDENAGNGHYQTEAYGAASTTGSDGHTFYGNVFGGGSGYFAYETTTTGVYEWLPSAGLVEGNTYVNISGGHILTNVYGGNEMTNVTGTTNVTMTGGTLGVPRTLAQIAAHPVTCYLFGGGKGDQRVHFNKSTNVGHAVVNVSGGIIYGSVFGGGEDGHVLGDVTMNISDGAKIGTWGTSYVDGNVFGGGRGFGGDAYTAGNVAGTVTMNITGGTMLGSIYGGGRLGSVGYGLFSKDEEGYGTMRADNVTEDGFTPPGGLTKGRGHVTVNISGDNTVIGNKYEYQYISPETTGEALATAKTYLPSTQFESNNRLKHTRGGNVFAGGMGRYTKLDGTSPISTYDGSGNLTSPIEWKKLGNVKSTKLTISGNPWIMGNVYGGGEFGAVQGSHQRYNGNTPLVDAQSKPIVASTEIIFSGGTIGTEITTTAPAKETIETTDTMSIVQYTFGSIYGGGMGLETPDATGNHGGDVKDSTFISMSKPGEAATLVRASVFGGGEVAIVEGNTRVNISGGEIGRNEVKPLSDDDAGYVLFGGATMGNVYGGGKGALGRTEAGLVKGNTNVSITGGEIYHMVYGGGALASVGNFSLSTGTVPDYIPLKNIPYGWAEGTGTATVNITGGVIGISGRDNGLVFGSSRGGLKKPEADANEGGKLVDPYDRVAWVKNSVVNIGTEGSGSVYTTPLIKGSVYGGGENGHNADSAIVNIYSGTIGIADKIPSTDRNDPWWDFKNDSLNTVYRGNRGNVYGAGSGSDTYTGDDGKEHYNPKSGMVGRNTVVNIYGGHVGRNVYGGGSMAMVGTITNVNDTISAAKHTSETTSFALSWPYKFEFEDNTGKATVNITGGHIGTLQTDGGDVYGSSRGKAGDRYTTAHLAYVKETEVNIDYPTTADLPNMEAIQNNFAIQCITGSVHGSGENGYVYGDTKVTLKNGLIGHSLYGGGKGKGTYTQTLNKIGGGSTYDAKIYSLIAGKVFGNTYVTMSGGRVGRNVYGGGNMGSVGKGNYASGPDDYYPDGYGETIGTALWTPSERFNPNVPISPSNIPVTDADYFLSSGKTTVNVIGGTVGYIDESNPTNSMKNQLPYGNVIGGSAGEAAPNLPASLTENRYLYCPAYYSGYVNETDVTIGGYRCKTAYGNFKVDTLITAEAFSSVAVGDTAKWQLVGPTIYASVYGGGQDGHVRRDTKVTVLGGEIGKPYNATNISFLKTDDLDSPQWMHRGNVYGGGSGITQYTSTLQYKDGTPDADKIPTTGYGSASGSVTRFTEVNILGGTIHRNVYGGGSMGSVGAPDLGQGYAPYKKDLSQANKANWGKQSQNTVNIGGGKGVVTIGTPYANGWTYDKTYGGEVYGACRGMSSLDPEQFANSVWTKVHIKDKATIMGNVYGGGDSGIVRKDSEVKIGDPVTP